MPKSSLSLTFATPILASVVDEEMSGKRLFALGGDTFEDTVMPFGLCNAPATFWAYIHQALRGLVDITVIVYLDDILIYSKNEDEHVEHVQEVLGRLRKHRLYA